MTGLLFALLAVMCAGVGARDQITMADMSERSGRSVALLVVAVVISLCTAILAAWAATAIIPMLTFKARLIFATVAFALAGAESLLIQPSRKAKEPTRSIGAFAVVMTAHQLTDAARFLIVAMAVLSGAPFDAAVGGAVGAILGLGVAWSAPELFERKRIQAIRRAIGAGLIMSALALGMRAFALI